MALRVAILKTEAPTQSYATLERRQDSSSTPTLPAQTGGGGPSISFPYIIIAAGAATVVLVVIATLSITAINRRRLVQSVEPYHPTFLSMPFRSSPQDTMPMPPLLEKKVAPLDRDVSQDATSWEHIQPLAVSFDEATSHEMRSVLNGPPGGPKTSTPLANVTPSVQVTCLVSLPTPKMQFPVRLRRRAGPAHARPSYESDLTGDLSHAHGFKRAPSIQSRASAREMGEARREAYLRSVAPDGIALPSSPPVPAPTGKPDGEEDVGVFAFGSVVLPVSQQGPRKDFGSKSAPLTKSDLLHVLDESKRFASPAST